MAKNKSGGASGVVLSMVQLAGEPLLVELARLFGERLANHGPASKDSAWDSVQVRLLPKVPRPECMTHFRAISGMETLAKIYGKALNNRLLDYDTEVSPCVLGCRRGRQALELIHTAATVFDKGHEWRRNIFILKVDGSVAFDSLSHVAIMRSCKLRGVPPALADGVLRELMRARLSFALCDVVSAPVLMQRGLKQGCPSSPTIFSVGRGGPSGAAYCQMVSAGISLQLSEPRMQGLCWADDLLRFSESVEGLVTMWLDIRSASASLGLAVNTVKSFWAATRTPPCGFPEDCLAVLADLRDASAEAGVQFWAYTSLSACRRARNGR